ncbi:MAG: hypothetical protein IJ530_12945 [Treponema sp.]|uniref:hypothetical protein n=1 Tax=Treponema sp. TaxID=166 RepID=UPI0025F5591D|nr:hypothetical protein [Treponema sp.]MBQ8680642.1 hypothetical protein [Treponema sp.]
MQIIGIYLEKGCDKRVIKNLHDGWYPFGNFDDCHGIFENDNISNKGKYKKIQEQIRENQIFINKLYELRDSKSPSINLNCILGMNGSGKSSLLNLEYRIINNFSCKINHCLRDFNQGHSLIWATGFNAELYYSLNEEIYCIRIKDNNIFEFVEDDENKSNHNPLERAELIYKNCEELNHLFSVLGNNKVTGKEYLVNEKKLIALLSEHFFYSISTNYSIYSNAIVQDFVKDEEEEWQKQIYHKNDGYLTPIVLVPYKDYGATIDTEKELRLAKERVSTLSLLIYLESGNDFIENLIPTKIKFALKSSKLYAEEIKKKYIKLLNPNGYDNDEVDNLYYELNKIYHIHKLHRTVKKLWFSELLTEGIDYLIPCKNSMKITKNLKKLIVQNSLEYLSYKIIKMCMYYDIYRNSFPEKNIISDYENYQDECIKNIKKIIDDIINKKYKIDFTNLKIYQCLQFFKNIDFYLSERKYTDLSEFKNIVMVNKFNEHLKSLKYRKLNYDCVFMNLLPPYFAKETFFTKKQKIEELTINQEVMLSALSSGESQLLNSLSYAVYHMKNASSPQKNHERIVYKNINLVFDEAELYYHPEYQRKLIADLLNLINRSNLTNIKSINITIVTHSPFMLSDIPNTNIIALENGKRKENLSFKTLGANIYDLLKNNFFMTSAIGNQTEHNITNFILYYNKSRKNKNFHSNEIEEAFYKKLIDSIGDDYLHSKLKDMFLQIFRE